jgi:hypothetical protein
MFTFSSIRNRNRSNRDFIERLATDTRTTIALYQQEQEAHEAEFAEAHSRISAIDELLHENAEERNATFAEACEQLTALVERVSVTATLWQERFLQSLGAGDGVLAACEHAGVSRSKVQAERKRNPNFAAAWDAAYVPPIRTRPQPIPGWQARFLAALAAGQSVKEATAQAGVSYSAPYNERHRNAAFARDWAALRPSRARERSAEV